MPPARSLLARGTSAETAQIEYYGLIGNMRTCALVATDGGVDYMCW